jgi:predicted RNase H-like HicB family nuclease
MSIDHYTYRVTWSPEDGEHFGLCLEFPSLSWLAETPEAALAGVRQVISEVIAEIVSLFLIRWLKNAIAVSFVFVSRPCCTANSHCLPLSRESA